MVKGDVPVLEAEVRVVEVVAALAPAKTKSINFHVIKKTDCSVFFITCVTSFFIVHANTKAQRQRTRIDPSQ